MIKVFWGVSLLMSVAGALVAYTGIAAANGAPQEAASAAMGLAIAVIPYCFSRAATEMTSKN